MKKDIKRVLVEVTVKRALKNAEESPERTLRNLVDLGVNFAKGRFQKRILLSAQQMLENENSAYYSLLKDVIENVDRDALSTFGINLGYNSCTVGAKKIRAVEAERRFNLPWALTLSLNEEKLSSYGEVFEQASALGIRTFLLFVPFESPEKLIPLLKDNPDSAFVLFVSGDRITQGVIDEMKPLKNIMTAVSLDGNAKSACELLRRNKMLYSLYDEYDESNAEKILNGEFVESVLEYHPCFSFSLASKNCPKETAEKVYSHIISTRNAQKYPVVLMDLLGDLQMIDEIVSDDVCLAGFTKNGNLFTGLGINRNEEFNLFNSRLENIFQKTMRKNKPTY